MKAISLFSGAGGLDLGLHAAGIETVQYVEIDKHARSVLAYHWPDTPIHDDVTTFGPKEFHGRVDLIHGGSPCQDLSLAGNRAGLGGERSGLFWHQCRVADSVAAPWVLWENVPGALNSNGGADFAAVLWGLTGALPDVPNEGWRTGGVCVGPKRTAAWRVFDARYFGAPQRRRRVFVVAGPRDGRAIEVLLEPESVCGDSRPSRPSGEVVAALTACGVGTCGADDNQAQAGHLIPVSFVENQRGEVRVSDTIGALTVGGGKPGQGFPAAMVPSTFRRRAHGDYVADAAGSTLTTKGDADRSDLVIGFGWGNSPSQGDDVVIDGVAPLRTRNSPGVLVDAAVRRLTPRECERVMGWPDDHTRFGVDGVEIADSHRYRMCGNGVVAPVSEWIGRRLVGVAA